MELISAWDRIEAELGVSLRDNFLMPVRTLDNPKVFTTLVLRSRGRRVAIFDDVESGNVEALALPPDLGVVYRRWYFTFDDLGRELPPRTLAQAVRKAGLDDDDIAVDPDLPVALFDELAGEFRVAVAAPAAPEAPVAVTAVPRAEVAARLRAGRAEAGPVVLGSLLARSPIRAAIAPYLEPPPERRFAELDRLLAGAGLAAVLVSSRLNAQEIAGLPLARVPRPLAVLYPAGGPSAYVIGPGGGGTGRGHATAGAALRSLLPAGRIGIEAEDLGIGLFRALGLESRDTAPADRLLRRWRDREARLDLAYYVLAARASAFAIESALAFAAAAVGEGREIGEREVDARYLAGLGAYVRESGLPVTVTRLMTNHHCGTRTLRPANPADYPVSAAVNTLKIDAGCMIFDGGGFLLACSDIARTLNFSPAAREIYPALVAGVRETLIPAARAGAVAEDVFEAGTEAVWGRRGRMACRGLAPDLPSLGAVYDRDVGHLLGRNDLAHLRFARGDRGRLEDGMVACLEYQWPTRGHALAYEDACVVTPSGGLNFTSDGAP